MVNLTFIWSFSLINWVDNVNWPPSIVSKLTLRALALRQSDWRNCGLCVCLPYLLDLNATLESSWFSRNVAWCLQVKHALAREISLLIWAIHSALFNFRFAINMATLNDAFYAIEQKRLLFLVHSARLTLTCACLKDAHTEYFLKASVNILK